MYIVLIYRHICAFFLAFFMDFLYLCSIQIEKQYIMAIRFYFKNEVVARQALHLCYALESWGYLITTGLPSGSVMGLETSEWNEGAILSEFSEDLIY